MRTWTIGLLVAAQAVAPQRLFAQAAAYGDTAPPSAFEIGAGADVTSDYRFRGISRSNRRIAVQGTATVTHASGLYVSAWASSVDDYVGSGGDAELDLVAGYKRSIAGTTLDGGLLYYLYPGSGQFGRTDADFFEPYLNAYRTFGPVSIKVGGNLAWKQRGLGLPNAQGDRREGGIYAFGDVTAAIPTTPVTITGHVGHSFVRNAITYGERYSDWSLSAAYVWKAFTFSAAYVDASRNIRSYPDGGGHDRNIAGSGVVGTIAVAF